jgi:hypothetical protein
LDGDLCPGCVAERPARLRAARRADHSVRLAAERRRTLPEARRLARPLRLHPGILRELREDLDRLADAIAAVQAEQAELRRELVEVAEAVAPLVLAGGPPS